MTGHIFLEGEFGDDVTVKTVRDDISAYPKATDWLVHINSGGGDVYEGYAIGNILESLPNTHAQIGASCCSIATYAAASCKKITMPPHGDWMIHLPTGGVQGNEHDFDRAANQLRRIKTELTDKYMKKVAKKGVLTREQVVSMIENETSMSPSEALQYGFIDDVQEKLRALAKFDINKFTDMENTVTKEELKGAFAAFGEKIDGMFKAIGKQFKNAVQLALTDGMVTSSANSVDEIIGSIITDSKGTILPDGAYESADGYVLVVSGGNGTVESYGPKTEDKADPAKALEAANAEITALKEQLAAKASEATAAVQATAKLEKEFKNQMTTIKAELETLQAKTFGDDTPPPADNKFKDGATKEKPIDPMGGLWDAFKSSR